MKKNKKINADNDIKKWTMGLGSVSCILLLISSLAGVCSINFNQSYEVMNQYGENILMYGYGIYKHDTYFKAPIQIGADLVALICLLPIFIGVYRNYQKKKNDFSRMWLVAVNGTTSYYALSQAIGVSYNRLFLIYIALFSCSLYSLFYYVHEWEGNSVQIRITKGKIIFLIMSCIALIAAWLPDIIPTLISGKPLALIGIYTTEITYVLDMGIIGPACMVCLILLRKKDRIAPLLYTSILFMCFIIALMVISGTVFQCLSGFEMTVPIIITKIGSFVVLGGFAFHFMRQLYISEKDTSYRESIGAH